ncbi:DUF4328 domain-containing protein [Streptomyces sp. NBC_01617]|nr:DUF4328 domain-containing protein [Streptomyces sp. NBC_01617]
MPARRPDPEARRTHHPDPRSSGASRSLRTGGSTCGTAHGLLSQAARRVGWAPHGPGYPRPARIAVRPTRIRTSNTEIRPIPLVTTVTLINAWWAAWLAHMAGAVTPTSAGYADSVVLSAVTQAGYLIAAVLVILVIQRITAAQTRAVATYTPAEEPAV